MQQVQAEKFPISNSAPDSNETCMRVPDVSILDTSTKEITATSSESLLPTTCSSTSEASTSLESKRNETRLSPDTHDTKITVSEFFQASKMLRALPNSEPFDFIFLHLANYLGLGEAVEEAARLGRQYQRPLRALLATIRESGRNYSARSAKRKPLLSAAASSRKRSSTV